MTWTEKGDFETTWRRNYWSKHGTNGLKENPLKNHKSFRI